MCSSFSSLIPTIIRIFVWSVPDLEEGKGPKSFFKPNCTEEKESWEQPRANQKAPKYKVRNTMQKQADLFTSYIETLREGITSHLVTWALSQNPTARNKINSCDFWGQGVNCGKGNSGEQQY